MKATLITGLLLVATARADEPRCPPAGKPFECHTDAVRRHLAGEKAAARSLYEDSCAKGYMPSCNNLAVLLVTVDPGADPVPLWKRACRPLAAIPCDNLRRWGTHRELARQLIVDDEQASQACGAGDLFRCEDAASRQRVAALLVDECRAGETTQCFDAAKLSGDPEVSASLMAAACSAGEGQACHALALKKPAPELWERACRDADFDVVLEDRASRASSCSEWAKARPRDNRRAATVAAGHCSAGDSAACSVAKDLFQAAGDARRAFAIVKSMCAASSGHESTACLELGDRYAMGDGTPRSVAKRIELLGEDCGPPSRWEACREVAGYGVSHRAAEPLGTYARWCESGTVEACYLGALAAETHRELRCSEPRWGALESIDVAYDAACRGGHGDACRHRAGLCKRAMDELVRLDELLCYQGGVGDGSWRFSNRAEAVQQLCPESDWTKAARRKIEEEAEYGRKLTEGMERLGR